MRLQNDLAGWLGVVTFVVVGNDGKVKRRTTLRNHITTAGLNLIRDGLQGLATDLKVKYVATGTGTTAPADGDTKLQAEGFRTAIAEYSQPGYGQMFTRVLLASGDSNFHIKELGWFAGVDATADPNTGVLVARVLYDYNKTVDSSVHIQRTDQIVRG